MLFFSPANSELSETDYEVDLNTLKLTQVLKRKKKTVPVQDSLQTEQATIIIQFNNQTILLIHKKKLFITCSSREQFL